MKPKFSLTAMPSSTSFGEDDRSRSLIEYRDKRHHHDSKATMNYNNNNRSSALLDDPDEIQLPALFVQHQSTVASCCDERYNSSHTDCVDPKESFTRRHSDMSDLTTTEPTTRRRSSRRCESSNERRRRSRSVSRASLSIKQVMEAEKNVKDALQQSSNSLMRSFVQKDIFGSNNGDDTTSVTSATEAETFEESGWFESTTTTMSSSNFVDGYPSSGGSSITLDDEVNEDDGDQEDEVIDTTTFEIFINRTAERQRRRSMRLKQQQSSAMLFTCSDMIRNDYTSILKMYKKGKVNLPSDKTDIVDIHLHACSHIVQQFLNVLDVLKETDDSVARLNDGMCYSRSPSQVVYSDMEKYILKQLSDLVASNSKLSITPLHVSKLICWYENYLQTIHEVYPDTTVIKPSPVWSTNIRELLEQYLEVGVRREIQDLIMNIDANRTASSSSNDEKHIVVTSLPEEIVYIIDVQIEVASGHLPEKYVPNVLQTCYELLSTIICDNMIQIETKWQNITAQQFCSLINDATRLHELITERNHFFFLKYTGSSTRCNSLEEEELTHVKVVNQCRDNIQQVQMKASNLEKELVELPLHATEYLCRHIINKLENPTEPILNSIGQVSWECDSTGSVISRTVITLLDYFKLFETSLIYADTLVFPKVLKKCFRYSVETYVNSFYNNTMTFGIRDASVVASNLKEDYMQLAKFFNSRLFARHTTQAGILSNQEINSVLLILQSMSRIMDPAVSPTDLQHDIRTLLERVSTNDESNVTAIVHLAGLRGRQNQSESFKWLRAIALAEYEIYVDSQVQLHEQDDATSAATCIKYAIQLPDLLKSPYLYRIRVSQELFDTMFTDQERMAYAQVTKDLLDKGYQLQLAMYMARKQQREEASKQRGSSAEDGTDIQRRQSMKGSERLGEKLGECRNKIAEAFGIRVSL